MKTIVKDALLALGKFLVPEADLSAKLIFDNVRNYIVIGAVFAVATWLLSGGKAAENPFFKPQFGGQTALVHSTVFVSGISLFVLNLLQSLELLRRFIVAAAAGFEKLQAQLGDHPSTFLALSGSLVLLLTVLAFVVAVVFVSVVLVLVVSAIVTFGGFAGAA